MSGAETSIAAGSTGRVPTALIAASIERLRDLLGLEFCCALYRHIARETGIHPTTLLRYHLGRLASAPRSLLVFLLRLEREVARGHELALEGRLRRKVPAPKPKTGSKRVTNAGVRGLMRELMARLHVPPNMFYRHVGSAVGLHPVTVFRHADGQLATAPPRLLDYLSTMAEALERGEEVVFTRAKLGTRVVPREFVVEQVRRLTHMGVFPSRSSLLRFAAASLGMKPRPLERAYSSGAHLLFPEEILHFLKNLIARLAYAPEARYQVGDRIYHPVFGCGVVISKERKDKLQVEFADGTRQVLREGLIELREWRRRQSCWDDSGT